MNEKSNSKAQKQETAINSALISYMPWYNTS